MCVTSESTTSFIVKNRSSPFVTWIVWLLRRDFIFSCGFSSTRAIYLRSNYPGSIIFFPTLISAHPYNKIKQNFFMLFQRNKKASLSLVSIMDLLPEDKCKLNGQDKIDTSSSGPSHSVLQCWLCTVEWLSVQWQINSSLGFTFCPSMRDHN